MSNEAQGLVRRVPLSAPLKPVLLAYANYADELGYCFAGVDCIAWDTGFDVRTVKRARGELIAAGWLLSRRRFGTSAVSRINLAKIEAAGQDRRPRTDTRIELEFADSDDVSAGRAQRGLSDPNVGTHSPQRRGHTVPNEGDSLTPTWGHTVPLSISYSSVDPSLDACEPVREAAAGPGGGTEEESREDEPAASAPVPASAVAAEPSAEATGLVAGLDFGPHRRPNLAQAQVLAVLVDQAVAGGLSPREVRFHARAAINNARPPRRGGNAVAYLTGALQPDRLPVPATAHTTATGSEKPADAPTSSARAKIQGAARAAVSAPSAVQEAARAQIARILNRPRTTGTAFA